MLQGSNYLIFHSLSFLGNTVKGTSDTHANKGLLGGKALDNAADKEISIGLRKMDDLLNELAQFCCVTVMPGQHDIATYMIPQKPLHPCMFPKSHRYSDFHSQIIFLSIMIPDQLESLTNEKKF